MSKNWRNTTAIFQTVLLGFVLFYAGTDEFRAFTAESARTYKLLQDKPKFPDVTLEDSKGRVYSFSKFKGKYIMLTFIYTACLDVCPKLEINGEDSFTHNSPFYLDDRKGYLAEVMDFTKIEEAANTVIKELKNDMGE